MRMSKSVPVKFAVCLLAVSLVFSPAPAWAEAGGAAGEKAERRDAAGEPVLAMSLDKAIAKAREKVSVPPELDMFRSDYQEHGGRGRWMFLWYSGKQPESSMHVSVNAVTGEIEGMKLQRFTTPGTRYSGLPAFSQDQCLEIARREAARLQPEKFAHTVPAHRDYFHPVPVLRERDYPVIYYFHFRRTAGGIPVTDQGISLSVNAETGEVTGFDLSWDDGGKMPSPEGRITPEAAKDIFVERAGLELTYYLTHRGNPEDFGQLRLVYRLGPPGRFFLNALTGQVIDTGTMDFYIDEAGGGGGGKGMMQSRMKADMKLTPAENRAVQETKDLISADRAQEIARKLLEVPGEYTVIARNLDRLHSIPGSRVWGIQFSDRDRKNWISVTVDARSGDLAGFDRDGRVDPEEYYKEPQLKVNEKAARQTADRLIEKMQPGRFGQVVFRQSEPELGPWIKGGKAVPRSYAFSYARMVKGVVYPEDGFRVRVSSTTGQVLSYDMHWWETDFPSPAGVMERISANEKYLEEYPLELLYSRGQDRWWHGFAPSVYHLIYTTGAGAGVMLDAFTGREIDHQGNPVVKKGKQPFTDISGHPAEEDIGLLAAEGIVAGDGGRFRPDDPVTAAEMLAMLVKAHNYQGPYHPLGDGEGESWYRPVLESARARGILDKGLTLNPGDVLNRTQMARLGINAGGWGKLAGIPEIFRLEVSDAPSIPWEYRGYAASAMGMGLLSPSGGKFDPGGGVTRAEAASFLVRLLKL